MLPSYSRTPSTPLPSTFTARQATADGWRARAACLGADCRLFDTHHPGERLPERTARFAAARAICSRCPVITACLIEAGVLGDTGIRGGLLLDHPHRGRRLPTTDQLSSRRRGRRTEHPPTPSTSCQVSGTRAAQAS